MRKLLAAAAVALSLAVIFMVASGQTFQHREPQSAVISSSTPSGGGQQRPYL